MAGHNNLAFKLNFVQFCAIWGLPYLRGSVKNAEHLAPHEMLFYFQDENQILSHDLQESNFMTEEVEGYVGLEYIKQLDGAKHLHEWEEDDGDGYEKISLSMKRKLLQSNTVPAQGDEDVLLQFKQAIVEDPSGVLLGWNVTANADYCQWRGVTCDQDTKRVIGLNITGKKTNNLVIINRPLPIAEIEIHTCFFFQTLAQILETEWCIELANLMEIALKM